MKRRPCVEGEELSSCTGATYKGPCEGAEEGGGEKMMAAGNIKSQDLDFETWKDDTKKKNETGWNAARLWLRQQIASQSFVWRQETSTWLKVGLLGSR